MSAILRFYSGEGTDGAGRTLAEIQALDVTRMEYYHDFIQWMFPLSDPSTYNPGAPVLTYDDIKAFHDQPELREKLRESFVAFLTFLGLEYDAEKNEVLDGRHDAARRTVFESPNHNWLRITRVLICLNTLGLQDEARAFFAFLKGLYESRAGITEKTFTFWRDAVGENSA